MANILILSLVFPPDSVSTAQIMGELAKDLRSRGHKITILTTYPHYNRDMEAESIQPLRRYWGKLLMKSDYFGIDVYHTFMLPKGKNIFLRLLSWVVFHLISTVASLRVIRKPSIILVPSPPLTIGVSAWILGKFYRVPFIYNVQEIYPDIAVSLGALRNKWLIKLLLRLESFVYRKASSISVIAPRMRNKLLGKGVPAKKVKVIPNFVDVDNLYPLAKNNNFSRQYKIEDKFVVSYAGNIGPAQGLDNLIEAAFLLRHESNIKFMITGNGILWDKLKERVTQLKLPNFIYLPYQPYSMMPYIYAASDICLVPQAPETGSDAIPSKVYRIMACGRPVLAVTESNSDLAYLVSSVGCGIIIQGEGPQEMAEVILNVYQNQRLLHHMGEAGRMHVVENYARTVVVNHYHKLIEELVLG